MWPQVESAGSAVTQRAALAPRTREEPPRRAEHSGREAAARPAGRARGADPADLPTPRPPLAHPTHPAHPGATRRWRWPPTP